LINVSKGTKKDERRYANKVPDEKKIIQARVQEEAQNLS
jgi:hypothetical protein